MDKLLSLLIKCHLKKISCIKGKTKIAIHYETAKQLGFFLQLAKTVNCKPNNYFYHKYSHVILK